jgi:hypothetical protein
LAARLAVDGPARNLCDMAREAVCGDARAWQGTEMIRRLPLILAPVLALAACTTPTAQTGSTAPVSEKPANMREAGLQRVVGKTAAELRALFGPADLDGREGQARKMQFVGPACVLDTYLIADKTGTEPVVTYIDARLPSGDDIDRASCIAALTRRDAAP